MHYIGEAVESVFKAGIRLALIAVTVIILLIAAIVWLLFKPVSTPIAETKQEIQIITKMGQPSAEKQEHGHKPGQFGGFIVELGRDNYHLEVVLKKDILEVYTLDKNESKIITVERQVIEAYVRGKAIEEDEQFMLNPKPQAGDGDGTSRFEGKVPSKYLLAEDEISISFNIVVKGDRFRARVIITLRTPQTDEERKLYLTPGGIYTEKDIAANGNVTASEKFKNFTSDHDFKPKKGDRICPITLTKANPKCAWIINGKEYWFCCPPCVEEFLKLAKESPEKVKGPEAYVKE